MKTVLMFTTKDCVPCKQMKEIMKDIDHTDIHLEYLDARDNMESVIKYGVRGVPHFVMKDDNDIIDQRSGVMSAEEYIDWIDQARYDYDGQPDEAQEWHDFDPDC